MSTATAAAAYFPLHIISCPVLPDPSIHDQVPSLLTPVMPVVGGYLVLLKLVFFRGVSLDTATPEGLSQCWVDVYKSNYFHRLAMTQCISSLSLPLSHCTPGLSGGGSAFCGKRDDKARVTRRGARAELSHWLHSRRASPTCSR